MTRTIQSLMFITVFSAVILFLQLFAVKKSLEIFNIPLNSVYYRIVCVAALFVPAVMMFSRIYPSVFSKILSLIILSYIGTVWIVFWCCIIWSVLLIIFPKTFILQLFFACITLFSVLWAFAEGSRLHIKTIVIESNLIETPVKLIHLTDIHAGYIHSNAHMKKIEQALRELKPDILAITGDFVDSSDVSHTLIESVSKTAPVCLFSMGNHDKYSGEGGVLAELEKAGVIHLNGSVYTVKNICVGGIDNIYPASKKIQDALAAVPFEKDKFCVLMSHQPPLFQDILKTPAQLTLSGHTHNGQIFPFGMFAAYFYPAVYGTYEQDGRMLYVSSGTGTWGPPMRLFTRNEIVVFTIVPALKFK